MCEMEPPTAVTFRLCLIAQALPAGRCSSVLRSSWRSAIATHPQSSAPCAVSVAEPFQTCSVRRRTCTIVYTVFERRVRRQNVYMNISATPRCWQGQQGQIPSHKAPAGDAQGYIYIGVTLCTRYIPQSAELMVSYGRFTHFSDLGSR